MTDAHQQTPRFTFQPSAITAGLFAFLVVATRWPFRTEFLYNWDAANLALGTRAFDVTLHQPHPPGYPYFVALGALLAPLFGDANGALVLVSIALEAVAVVAVFLLGARIFSAGVGAAAALLLTVSVTFWAYGEVALGYPALAAFSALTALFAYQTAFEQRDRALPCALAYAVGTGFQPDLALFLLPLLLVACWRQPAVRFAGAAAIAIGGVLLWLIPTALLSGGFGQYWAALSASFGADVAARAAPTGGGWPGLVVNLGDTAQYTFDALYAEALVVAGGVFLLVVTRPSRKEWLPFLFLAVWVAPIVGFYALAQVGDPGQVLGMLPAVLLFGLGGWWRWLRNRPPEWTTLAGSGLALVLLANVLILFLYDEPLTLAGLRKNDVQVQSRLAFLAAQKPEQVLLVTHDSYKQLRYYLPAYTNSVWLDTSTLRPQRFPIPAGVTEVVLTDPSVFWLLMALPAQADHLPGDTWVATLAAAPGQVLVYENGRLRLDG